MAESAARAIGTMDRRSSIHEGNAMLQSFVRLREGAIRLRRVAIGKRGVVSFESVIVAACIGTAVITLFGTDATTGIGKALSDGIAKVVAKLP